MMMSSHIGASLLCRTRESSLHSTSAMSRNLLSLPAIVLICLALALSACENPDQPLVESEVPRGDTEVLDPAAEPSDLEAPESEDAAMDATLDPLPTDDESDVEDENRHE